MVVGSSGDSSSYGQSNVQISAALAIAKRALHVISTLLHQNPRKDKAPIVGGKECFVLVPPMIPSTNLTRPGPGSNGHGALPSWMSEYATEPPRFGHDDFNGFNNGSPGVTPGQDPPMDFSIKILCCSAKIRAVIGTTGSNVRQLQQETRTNKHVGDVFVESDERVICVDDSNDEGMDIIAKESGVKRYMWLVCMDKKGKEEERRQKEILKGDPAIRKLSRKEQRKSSEIGREKERESARVSGSE
ncbi:K homology domain-containing protein [Tanacetum coccineum]